MHSLSTFANNLIGKISQTPLGNLGVLSVSGEDANKFLQGQATCDFKKLTAATSLYGAICNNKGRIICNFYAVQDDSQVYLIMDRELVDTALSYLKKFAVFFKVSLTNHSDELRIESEFNVADETVMPDTLSETLLTNRTSDCITLNVSQFPVSIIWKIFKEQTKPNDQKQSLDVLNLLAARPLITKDQSEEVLPQWLNMQRTGGISFKKGCYTGQEIVARMQYRGKSKKQLALFTWQGDISAEKDITDGEGKILGQVFQVAQFENTLVALVVLNIDPTEAENFMLGQTSLEHLPLPYQLEKTEA